MADGCYLPGGYIESLVRGRATRAALAVLFSLAILPTILLSGAADVTGTWDLRVESAQGTANPTIILKQDGDRISGVYRGRLGEARLDGRISGENIEFAVTLKFQDQPIVVKYSGTVAGDVMRGTVEFGDVGSGRWSAKRRSN